jgi:hypothetical protein
MKSTGLVSILALPYREWGKRFQLLLLSVPANGPKMPLACLSAITATLSAGKF